jgi:hypothetical protein
LAQPVVHAELEGTRATAHRTSQTQLERLRAALAETVASSVDAIEVLVADRCGELEVQVSGSSWRLRMAFDPADAEVAFVRSAVCRTVARYAGVIEPPCGRAGSSEGD